MMLTSCIHRSLIIAIPKAKYLHTTCEINKAKTNFRTYIVESYKEFYTNDACLKDFIMNISIFNC